MQIVNFNIVNLYSSNMVKQFYFIFYLFYELIYVLFYFVVKRWSIMQYCLYLQEIIDYIDKWQRELYRDLRNKYLYKRYESNFFDIGIFIDGFCLNILKGFRMQG